MERVVNMTSDQYDEFIKCLSILRDHCTDVDIHSGKVCQRSNDNASIFEFDLSPLIEDIDLPISNLNEKLNILKFFGGQEVQLTITDKEFLFAGLYALYKWKSPARRYIDNLFMSEEELSSVFTIDEEKLVVDYEMSTSITDMIKGITQEFDLSAIQVVFEGETVSISVWGPSKDQFVRFVEGIVSNVVIEKSKSNLTITPFVIEHDSDIHLKMYESPQEGVFVNKFSTTLGEADVVIYTRSSLVKEDKE